MEPAPKPRKACDSCYRRKIKCDGESPKCSNCNVYQSDCTYVAASRKKKTKQQRAPSARDAVESSAAAMSPSSRTDILEEWLGAPLQENQDLKGSVCNDPAIASRSISAGRSEDVVPQSRQLELPPRDIVYSLIRTYLSTFNSFLPLFDSQTLLNTVHKWYSHPTQRTSTAWASIYTTMALAQYQGSQPQHPQVSVADCLRNAQSVVSDLIMRDAELASVQVVLGLVALFIGTPDPRPSSILVATAIQLLHGMMLHRREGYYGINASEALQRKRVFWMAYILDRDISLRTRQPPVQHDSEIDVDMPLESSDGAGAITALWSNENFNFFQSRIQLARIQGQVYDCLYSVSAQRMAPQDLTMRAMQLRQEIKEWQLLIPPDFSAEVLSHDNLTVLPQYFCHLYSPYVSCLGQLCRATSVDLPWMEALLSYARKIEIGDLSPRPIIPEGWESLVSGSRSLMNLFTSVQHKEAAFVWTNICTYTSGLVCLLANSILQMQSTFPELDQDLREGALVFVAQLSQQANHEGLRKIGLACAELNEHVVSVANMAGSNLPRVAQA